MNRSVIVVGAGITGVASAEWLRRDGWQVTLVDRIEPGDPAQASYGNGGILARCSVIPVSVPGLLAKAPKMLLDPKSPLFLRWSYLPRLLPWLVPFLRNGRRDKMEQIARALEPLTSDSVDQHLLLAKGTAAERLIESGDYAYLYTDREAFEKDAMGMALRQALGFTFRELDRKAMLDRDPHLGPHYNFSASFTDHGWIRAPGAYVAALAQHFVGEGGSLVRGEVHDIAPGEPVTVRLDDGRTLTADRVVLASGVWSGALAHKLGHSTSMVTERGYHLLLKSPSSMPPNPYMIADSKFVATPMDLGLRCAGVVEFAKLGDPPSKAPVDVLRNGIRRAYPTLSWEGEEQWLGNRPSTSDSLPMLGLAPKAPGVVFAFGSQHIGMTIGPRLGRMVADILGEKRTNLDLKPYSTDRFDT